MSGNSQISRLDQVLNDFGPCSEDRNRNNNNHHDSNLTPIDAAAPSGGVSDVAVVLDTSAYEYNDREYIKQVAASVGETVFYLFWKLF